MSAPSPPEDQAAGPRTIDRRAGAILIWIALIAAGALAISARSELKYLQNITWPTDLYAFQQLDQAPLDVALLGSSRTTFGLAPTAIDPCLEEALGRPTVTVNLARVFASIVAERIIARDLLRDEQIPRVAVVELAPEILNSTHHEHAHNLASHVGLRDIPSCLGSARSGDEAVACARAPLRGIENLTQLISGRYRDTDHRTWMMVYHRGGQFCFDGPECASHNEAFSDRLQARWEKRIQDVIPHIREERYSEYVLGEGVAHDALLELIAEADERGYRLVFLNMPIHQTYWEQIPPDRYAEYLAYIEGIRATHDIPWMDANTPEWRGDRSRYHDPDHLNAEGARLLSQQVCEALLVPALREDEPS